MYTYFYVYNYYIIYIYLYTVSKVTILFCTSDNSWPPPHLPPCLVK